jgi:hypothetical protein
MEDVIEYGKLRDFEEQLGRKLERLPLISRAIVEELREKGKFKLRFEECIIRMLVPSDIKAEDWPKEWKYYLDPLEAPLLYLEGIKIHGNGFAEIKVDERTTGIHVKNKEIKIGVLTDFGGKDGKPWFIKTDYILPKDFFDFLKLSRIAMRSIEVSIFNGDLEIIPKAYIVEASGRKVAASLLDLSRMEDC